MGNIKIKTTYVAGKYELISWNGEKGFSYFTKIEAKYLFKLNDKLHLFKGINLIED